MESIDLFSDWLHSHCEIMDKTARRKTIPVEDIIDYCEKSLALISALRRIADNEQEKLKRIKNLISNDIKEDA